MQCVSVVAVLAVLVGLALGNPNVKTIEDLCGIVQKMEGQTVNEALMQTMLPKMMSFYAPIVDCSQVATSEEFGFSLEGVPVTACFSETTKKYEGWQIIDMRCEDIAIDQSGKSVMLYQPSTFRTSTGQTVSMPIFSKYDFNDAGQIASYVSQFDTSALDLATPAVKNAAVIKYQCSILQETVGQTISPALMEKLGPQMVQLYTPLIDCSQVATSKAFGFNLKAVPTTECLSEASKKYGGLQIVDMQCKDIAPDKHGDSVMVYEVATFRMPAGQTVIVPIFLKYDFNRDGKIVAYSSQFDTSFLETSSVAYNPQFTASAMKNSATIKSVCSAFKEMAEGQLLNQALMEKLLRGMMGFYAPTINCDQVATSAEFGFRLNGVPVAACFGEGAKKYGGMRIIHMECKDVTADKSGKSVMLYQPSTFRLTTGQMVNVPILSKYDFNDAGQIIAYSIQFDTSVLEAYSMRYPENSLKFATPAARNLATAKNACNMFQEMVGGQTVNTGLMEKLVLEMTGFYAPTVNCNQVATNKEFGFSLHDVPVATCFAEGAKKYGGMKVVQMRCADIAVDTNGKTVMLYQPSTFKMPTGQMINVPFVSKYDFNDEGKISSYSIQFDASVLSTYRPLFQYHGSQVTSSVPRTSAAVENSAAVTHMCEILKEMEGQTISASLAQKLTPLLMGFYAPTVDCNMVPSSTEFGFTLDGVPPASCFAETTAKFGGTQIIDVACKDVAADQSGKSVILYQPSTLRTSTGQTILVPIVTKYDFDVNGKVVAYSIQFDTSVFAQAPIALVAYAGDWSASLVLAFFFGCIVTVLATRMVPKRQQTPLLHDGYNPCA